MIRLERDEEVFTITMDAGENRWNTAFVREFSAALEEVEGSAGPAALVTRSADPKFFSNGLDLAWVQAPDEHPQGGDRAVFGAEFMALMSRLILLPVPSVAAVNGHAFGAGFMAALCHDVRVQRRDRGFLCANEMALGMTIPTPELALFKHKLPQNAFFETVQLARRWTGPDALAAGVVQAVADADGLDGLALAKARELAPLGANRDVYGAQKARLFGENAVLDGPHGAAWMLAHSADYR